MTTIDIGNNKQLTEILYFSKVIPDKESYASFSVHAQPMRDDVTL